MQARPEDLVKERVLVSPGITSPTTKEENQLKRILFWNHETFYFGVGRDPFLRAGCPVNSCYITTNRNEVPYQELDALVWIPLAEDRSFPPVRYGSFIRLETHRTHLRNKDYARGKTKQAAWFVSKCGAVNSGRATPALLFSRYDILPVVYGLGAYEETAPPHSFINVFDFPSVRHLADYLIYLDKNDTAYNEYFQ
ncbi:hypothetical protein HAZT_HAZT006526 [Hyalella azteca]|uniref:Fucosyltransferase n=1 Tax=Hyalella azteca TaxID=294128 RepID=A0A6A0H2M5_HYAAZ|nr:hypothetical protein HAZT_HAZT006526 [Hyalella azteca]